MIEKTTKLQLKTTAELWQAVLGFRIRAGLKNNNDAVEHLIKKGLEPEDAAYLSQVGIPQDLVSDIVEFMSKMPLVENKLSIPLLISNDKKSNSFFTECHLKASDLIKYTDKDLSIDPELQEEYRANRKLEPDNRYFLQMVEDAKNGRSFSDLVIEFNTSYTENKSKPLKILGGQHRDEAIKRALKEGVDVVHGVKVYFGLNKNKRAEIMEISNTNINVSPDLRDRIEEHRLEPSGMLREFCFETGIMKKGEDFGDKRRYEEEFTPTVRMMRDFIVSFFKGKEYKGNIDEDAEIPYDCDSGKVIDKEYLKLFNKFKKEKSFNDKELINAGKMFAKLHQSQFKKADTIKGSRKKEYKIKAFSLSLISSWAFAAGVLQKHEKRLNKLYSLPNLSGEHDPLNAIAMSKAKHPSIDSETYRGLGTRVSGKERGRLLHLFLIYSESDKLKIDQQLCNSAIQVFHGNEAKKKAEESRKRAL